MSLSILQNLKRVLLSLALVWGSLALAKPLVLDTNLSSYQTLTLPFTLEENDFVRGEYKTSARIKGITLVDEHQKPIRRLSEPFAQEERFLFTAPYTGKYALVIEALVQEASINCTLDILKPLSQKATSLQEPIISPTLLKMQGVSDTKAFWEKMKIWRGFHRRIAVRGFRNRWSGRRVVPGFRSSCVRSRNRWSGGSP